MRGVAEGKAFAVAKGMIEIGINGGGTNTYLTQNVLMLDSTSKVDAVPALEIKTNDVKASHSATVSRLTAEDLFYFGSRSIDPVTARAMYVQGFLGDITQRILNHKMRTEVMEMIEKKYSQVL
jgi:Fe-S cluster assembly protein SufB/Fe-S cluster assembly protein SufD